MAAMYAAAATIVALALALSAAGCAEATCFGAKDDDKYDSCVAEEKAARRSEREAARVERQNKENSQAAAAAARPRCKQGDANACLTVASHGARYGGDAKEIAAAFTVACAGDLAPGCAGGGDFAEKHGDQPTALARYRRACELKDSRGCMAAAELDPTNAMALETSACELAEYEACYRVGQGHLAAHRRDDAVKYLTLACQHDHKPACEQLGRIDVGGQP